MKKVKALEKILSASFKKAQDEMSALLAQEVALTNSVVVQTTREELFDELEDEQICAEITVEGSTNGKGILLSSLGAALTMGGTLIMLPENEIAERIEKKEFGEDEADAFGEIINIYSGVLTKLFDDLYSDEIRFVKGPLGRLDPLKVSTKGEFPIEEGQLWVTRASWELNGSKLAGECIIALPAAQLGVEPAAEPAAAEPAAAEPAAVEPAAVEPAAAEPAAAEPAAAEPAAAEPAAAEPAAAEPTKRAAALGVAGFKKILKSANNKVIDDVSGFLGAQISLADEVMEVVDREAYFDAKSDPLVLVKFDVEGDRKGEAILLCDLAAAIKLGGTLIMLPEDEVANRVEAKEFGEEDADAFGEVANIIAGVYNSTFNDLFPASLRLIKSGLEKIDPLAVSTKQEYPISDEQLFLSGACLSLADNQIGRVELLLSYDMLQLTEEQRAATAAGTSTSAASTSASPAESATPASEGAPVTEKPLVLVFCEGETTAEEFVAALRSLNFECEVLPMQEDARDSLHSSDLRGVMLVMEKVQEQGIAAAIKIKSIVPPKLPLIAAGPDWTKSMVLRAVKYGVHDILVTPASEAQIQEKVRTNVLH